MFKLWVISSIVLSIIFSAVDKLEWIDVDFNILGVTILFWVLLTIELEVN